MKVSTRRLVDQALQARAEAEKTRLAAARAARELVASLRSTHTHREIGKLLWFNGVG